MFALVIGRQNAHTNRKLHSTYLLPYKEIKMRNGISWKKLDLTVVFQSLAWEEIMVSKKEIKVI